ncbi:hypothetical protein SUGI_0026370 [Cryptomeria japonica]|nr:hypothetical protein SUGI_0026370 [Cryptomeria japonica]
MQIIGNCKPVALLIVVVMWCIAFTSAQPGFLSIDCGGLLNRTDPETNITWVTDDNYIRGSGIRENINNATSPFYLQSARVFPYPTNKSCFEIPLTPNIPHLLRLWFNAGNFNGLQQIPRFDLSYETTDMLSMGQVRFEQMPAWGERVLVSSGNVVYVCLIRKSDEDNLFISAIELRTLEKGMYDVVKPGQWLRLLLRTDAGANSASRYPNDRFDRQWNSSSTGGAENVQVKYSISIDNAKNLPPNPVMQTALVSNSDIMSFSLPQYRTPERIKSFVLFLYFAEIETYNASEPRIFHLSMNNVTRVHNITLQGDFSARELELESETPDNYFALQKNSFSTRGPTINAFEYYILLLTHTLTFPADAQALATLKQRFNIKDWVSDPCFVVAWDGIQCMNISSTVRVAEIDLSRRNLTGTIPPSLGQMTELVQISFDGNNLSGAFPNLSSLTKLERLYLQNNNLSGTIPDWLSELENLKELDIANNNFSGVIPQRLLDKQHSLKINYSGNYYLCMRKGECIPSSSGGYKLKVILGVVVSGFGIIGLAILIGALIYRKKIFKRRNPNKIPNYSEVLVPSISKSRAFSLDEIKIATEDFSHNIGQGGFGFVFWGKLRDEKQIAVKVLSFFSKEGVAQFLNEIDLLSRVHHKNLVALLGYCNESRDLMLIYEYMPGSSLNHRLYDRNHLVYPKLEWKIRLKIALDAAQGLEYLHVGCTPKIIHRDVKTANILLDANFNAKLADFGLSRVATDDEASHVVTDVKGTAGYLDPKYFSTHMLTDKSDVYSFGVVLLEIICGRRPVDFKQSEEKIDLVKWVAQHFERVKDSEEVLKTVDKELLEDDNLKSIISVIKLAMKCIVEEPSCRPGMSEVVMEIKRAMKYENDSAASTL